MIPGAVRRCGDSEREMQSALEGRSGDQMGAHVRGFLDVA